MSICPKPNAIRFFKESESFRFGSSGGFPVIYAGESEVIRRDDLDVNY